MPRIRSLHPGIFTDERYMALSFPARELIKGIWCEADDQGVFEWKALTLKARILPADAVDVEELLAELKAGQFLTDFAIDGRKYGAVRNFRRFQRPKKPNEVHLLPAELRTYVGLSGDDGEPPPDERPPVPHQFPTEGEKPPQMEDVGGRKKEGGKKPRLVKPESEARALRAPPDYAFRGAVIRLSQADIDRWKSSYSAIPDIVAELETIDAKFVDEGFDGKNWFSRASGWMRARHEELLRRQSVEDEAYRGVL